MLIVDLDSVFESDGEGVEGGGRAGARWRSPLSRAVPARGRARGLAALLHTLTRICPDGDTDAWVLSRHARLLIAELGLLTRARIAALLAGGILLPLLTFLPGFTAAPVPLIALVCCAFAEFAERYSFFRAVVTPKMPGL